MDRWRDRVAVVTGASEGIGEAIVRKLAASGMKVVALARRQQLLEALEKDVNSSLTGVRCYTRSCDVSDELQVRSVFDWIQRQLGAVSVIVNNAAIFKFMPLVDMDPKAVKSTFDLNILGVVYCTQQALASMRAANINDGHIININSDLGHRDTCMPGAAAYSASKHALTAFTISLKRELAEAKSKIRVTSLSPGLVRTSMTTAIWKENPGEPALEAQDVAAGVIFALSMPATVNVSELMMQPV